MIVVREQTQIIIEKQEVRVLKKELEELFIKATGTGEGFYSLSETEVKYPATVKLFKIA